MKYGNRLKMLREQKKLSQQQLSDLLNINRSTYARYELNQTQPDIETLKLIADFYNVSTDYIVGRSDDPRLTEDQQKEVDEEFQELKKIIESLPEEEQEKVKQMVVAYVKGYADSLDRKENKQSE